MWPKASSAIIFLLASVACLNVAAARADVWASVSSSTQGSTCNIVGQNELKPGVSPLALARLLAAKRDNWNAAYEDNDRRYRVALMDQIAPAYEYGPRILALLEEGRTFKFYKQNCQEKLDALTKETQIEFWSDVAKGPAILGLPELLRLPNTDEIGFTDATRAFADAKTFEAWVIKMQADPLQQRAAFYGSRNPELAVCAQTLEEGASKRIQKGLELTRCTDNRWYRYNVGYVGYKTTFENGLFVIDHSISLYYGGAHAKRMPAIQRVLDQQSCVERYYASQGLMLRLGFHFDRDDPNLGKSDVNVTLVDKSAETNDHFWAVFSDDSGPMNDSELCATMAHEIGHHFRLNDLYKGGCQDSGDVMPVQMSNLMSSGSQSITWATFEHWQARRIVNPLCGPRVAPTQR